MESLKTPPDWLATAVIGAVFAVLGYVGKSLVDWWKQKRKERAKTIAQLDGLHSLLNASREVFGIQHERVERLMKLLEANHPDQFREDAGYDEAMARCHGVLNQEERELYDIVRSYTEHTVRKLNQSMTQWLEADTTFKTGIAPTSRQRELARQLFALEIHLLLWHAKYEAWIPGHPERALVYLADEGEHGLGFPGIDEVKQDGVTVEIPGVEEEVTSALDELRKKWR